MPMTAGPQQQWQEQEATQTVMVKKSGSYSLNNKRKIL